jgi:hypothetical protein
MLAQFIATTPVTTTGACHHEHCEGDGSRDDNKPVLHGS